MFKVPMSGVLLKSALGFGFILHFLLAWTATLQFALLCCHILLVVELFLLDDWVYDSLSRRYESPCVVV